MKFLLIILLFIGSCSIAQVSHYSIPQLNLSKKFSNNWKLILKNESHLDFTSDNPFSKHEASILGSKKFGINNVFAFGYLAQIKEDSYTNRLIIQYGKVQKLERLRLAHRLSMEKSFNSLSVSNRYRYRLALDGPISGYSIDVKEFYYKISDEYLLTYKNGYSSKNRFAFHIGYVISKKSKIEIGNTLINSVFRNNSGMDLWTSGALYLSF